MLITVPGKKELNNYDGRYGYYRSETTDFVLLQNPNISLSEWWSSIYGKQNNFRFIEIYSSYPTVHIKNTITKASDNFGNCSFTAADRAGNPDQFHLFFLFQKVSRLINRFGCFCA